MAKYMAGSIFLAAALICLGFFVALAYEGYAVITGKDPTISAITALQIASHPVVSGLAIFGSGVLIGALVTHFTNWRP